MALHSTDRDEDNAALMAEINTTPLVDVMLVLLVIFLVTAPMLTQAVKLELPTETTAEVMDKDPITLSVDETGTYYWNQQTLPLDRISERMREEATIDKARAIHLRADTNTAYGNVSALLALAQKHGLSNIGFVTEPE